MISVQLGNDTITARQAPDLLLTERYGKHHKLSLSCAEGAFKPLLLGETVSLSIETENGTVAGTVVVSDLASGGKLDHHRQKVKGHSPTKVLERINMRSFANKSAEDILRVVLNAYNSGFSTNIPALKTPLDYVVQLESDYDFIRRLCTELRVGLYYTGRGIQCQELEAPSQADFEVEESKLKEWTLKLSTPAPSLDLAGFNYASNQSVRLQEKFFSTNILARHGIQCSQKPTDELSKMICVRHAGDESALRRQAGALYRNNRPPVLFEGASSNPQFRPGKIVRFQPQKSVFQDLRPGDADFMFRIIEVKHQVQGNSYSNTFIACSADYPANPLLPQVQAPRIHFMHGIVLDNQDTDKLGRVQVRLPWDKPENAQWLRALQPQAGKTMHWHCPPEKNSRVLVAFEDGRADSAGYVLGSFFNGGVKTPGEWDNKYGFQIGDLKVQFDPASGKVAINGAEIAISASGVLKVNGSEIEIGASGKTSVKGREIHLN